MKKKILLIIFLLIFIGFISSQVFFICTNKGNLKFVVCNEALPDSVHIEIYIDGKKALEDRLEVPYNIYSLKTSLSSHIAIIKIDGYESEEIRFNTILFTSIYVDYSVDKLNQNKQRIYFEIQKHPIYYLS